MFAFLFCRQQKNRRTESVIIMHTLDTPLPKDAQLSCMNALLSRDWSIIQFRFAWLCSVDWDVAGPFDSDAPIVADVRLIID